MISSNNLRLKALVFLLFISIAALGIVLWKENILFKADKIATEDEGVIAGNQSLAPANGELLVKFKSTTSKVKKDKFLAKHSAQVKKTIDKINVDVISIPAALSPEQKAKEIRQTDANDIEFVEPNYIAKPTLVPNDTYYTTNQANWYKTANAEAGWDIAQGDNVIIGVVDTGVYAAHPDLQAKLLPGINVVDNSTNLSDVYSHGTDTAGVSSAISNNTAGVVGSSLNSKILPIRMTNNSDGSGLYSDEAEGIIYAADHGASVINTSFSGSSASTTLQNAVNYAKAKNVTVVASAGNTGTEQIRYPAGCNGVIGVSGLSEGSGYTALEGWSSYGSHVDVSSAGCMYTTANGGGYENFCGTSNSAPIVTGLVALMKSINPALTVQQVTDVIVRNTTDLGPIGWDKYFGWGRIDYGKTLAAVRDGNIPVAAQGVLSGRVTDASTGVFVAGATVSATISGTTTTTQTLSDGSYTLNLDAGTYSLIVSAPNYVTATQNNIVISAGTATTTNISLSPSASVDVTAPTVSISSPTVNSTLKIGSKLTAIATASDNEAVTKVEFYLNGVLSATDTRAPYSASLNTRKATIDANTIMVKAYDAAGNIGQAIVMVNFTK